MKEYMVKWEMPISARSPRQAAEEALTIQRDRTSIATMFTVDGETVDLDQD